MVSTSGASTSSGVSTSGGQSTWTVTFDPPFTAFARRFDRFAEHIDDATAVWEQIAASLEDEVARGFDTEGSSTGTKWHPLSRGYATWKARHYPGRRILEATGDLRRSYEKGGGGHIRKLEPRSMVWGSEVPYGRFHQAGGSRLPRRPILRLTGQVKDQWERIIHKFIIDSVRESVRAAG